MVPFTFHAHDRPEEREGEGEIPITLSPFLPALQERHEEGGEKFEEATAPMGAPVI